MVEATIAGTPRPSALSELAPRGIAGLTLARVIQQDPHGSGGDTEEVRAVLPFDVLLAAGQPHIGFVDHRGGLQGVALRSTERRREFSA